MNVDSSDASELSNFLKVLGLIVIDGYRFERPLSGGQMATTVLYANSSGHRIVYKFLMVPRREAELRQFEREAETLLDLNNRAYAPFLVKGISRVVKAKGYPVYYFSMEYLEGTSLDRLMKCDSLPWSAEKATDFLYRIASAVSPALFAGVVHRDLHPGNILICDSLASGSPGNAYYDPGVRILDFGASRNWVGDLLGSALQGSRTNFRHIGAISTWSPESLISPAKVGPAHDIWALGSLYFRMLTGRKPFPAESFGEYLDQVSKARLEKRLLATAPILPKHIIRRSFEPEPDRRLTVANMTKMCFDFLYMNVGRECEVSCEDLALYLHNDGDIWVCLRCGGLMINTKHARNLRHDHQPQQHDNSTITSGTIQQQLPSDAPHD